MESVGIGVDWSQSRPRVWKRLLVRDHLVGVRADACVSKVRLLYLIKTGPGLAEDELGHAQA